MLVDTHCHLDFSEFEADRDVVVENAKTAGVGILINVASSLKGSQDAVRLASVYENVWATVGIHPHDAREAGDETCTALEGLAGEKKVVAVGEVGLDFYRNLSAPDVQRRIFRYFIEMASRRRLPLVVHSRDAGDETLAILKEYQDGIFPGVVIHCFSGGLDFLKQCLDAGFFVSFTCNVTYKKAESLREALRYVPLERMFLETDAPFLAPEGRRGKRNEPAYLAELAREAAVVKGVSFEDICYQTTQNALKFFNIDAQGREKT